MWPAHKPLLVRISAVRLGARRHHDRRIPSRSRARSPSTARRAIDVSTGEVVAHERPAYGRSYQTPFAERIRHAVGVPTIAVGGISTQDDATSIISPGGRTWSPIGRANLHDPAWALHAAAELGYRGPGAEWPAHYRRRGRAATGSERGPAAAPADASTAPEPARSPALAARRPSSVRPLKIAR